MGEKKKVENREIYMIFIVYTKNHKGNCYDVYNSTTGYHMAASYMLEMMFLCQIFCLMMFG